jgi:uncharacterized protein YaaQ
MQKFPAYIGFTKYDLEQHAAEGNFHQAVKSALRWLVDDGHLSKEMALINNSYAQVALALAYASPVSQQTTISINKLVEAKDAAIRAVIFQKEVDEIVESKISKHHN